MALRPYQSALIVAVRALLALHRCVMMQLATGGGKTRIFCEMVALAVAKKNPVWIVVPRNELLGQASDQLSALKQSHGKISAKSKESRAYNVHVVSKDTLIRRIKADKIKKWPALVIFDEAHLALDQQLFIRDSAPDSCRFIGVTATPEKLDGRGLDEMYGDITYGPTLSELVEMDYLCNVRYFGIPGITPDDFSSKDFSGTEVKADALDEILKKRQIYGDMIAHYRREAHNKPCIVFCRSVKLAEDTAQRFRDAGYRFESIDGKMTDKQRKTLIDGLASGRIHGLTSCELICYGLDIPKVECIIKLRFTLSKALDSQMNGRGLRPFEGKDACIILDPVGCLIEHGHPLDDYEWKFHGKEKRGKKKGVSVASIKQCKVCFMYFRGDACENKTCDMFGIKPGGKGKKRYEEIDGRLIEVTGPVSLKDRPPEEKREFQDKYNELIEAIKAADSDDLMDKFIKELLDLAAEHKQNFMSVYWKLSEGMKVINMPILHAIRRVRGYAPGWIYMQRGPIEKRLGR